MPAIFSTNDGGDNWSIQTFGVDESLSSIYFADEMNGWAVGGTASGCIILHTKYQKLFSHQEEPLEVVYFISILYCISLELLSL